MAFDSPNLEPFVKMGITNDENEHSSSFPWCEVENSPINNNDKH
jgi:hypothetical protein